VGIETKVGCVVWCGVVWCGEVWRNVEGCKCATAGSALTSADLPPAR